MTDYWMSFNVLDVGQGSANYIELRDGTTLKAAAIVDVGSEQWKRIAGDPSTAWVAKQLKTMEGGAKLDAVVLSHSDNDHVNLIPSLLRHFDPPNDDDPELPVLTVERVCYGGDYSKYKKGNQRNFLSRLNDYGPEDEDDILEELDGNWSSFDRAEAKWKPLVKIGGQIELWVLSANTSAEMLPDAGSKKRKRAELPDAYGINTRSIVVAARFGGKTLIATGDATGLTLLHCNRVLKKQAVRTKLGSVFMVTIPHHGSDTTTYDLTGSSHGHADAVANVRTFVDYVNADTISGSSGERRTFRHPSPRVIHDFGRHMLHGNQYEDPSLKKQKLDQHFYTSYFEDRTLKLTGGTEAQWPDGSGWWTARTDENVFTTDYFAEPEGTLIPRAYPWDARLKDLDDLDPEPPRAISWAFDIAPGAARIEPARDRTTGAPAYWAAVEELHGPLPDERFVWVPSAHTGEPPRPVGAARPAPRPEHTRPARARAAEQEPPPAPSATPSPAAPSPAAHAAAAAAAAAAEAPPPPPPSRRLRQLP